MERRWVRGYGYNASREEGQGNERDANDRFESSGESHRPALAFAKERCGFEESFAKHDCLHRSTAFDTASGNRSSVLGKIKMAAEKAAT
jgi:hypothetical protein